MIEVVTLLAEMITEFDEVKGIAIKLLIVGLFWAFNLSNILTASTDDKFSKFITETLAVLS